MKVIKFGSDWCNPCKIVAPIFKELKEENPEIEFVSVDIDDTEIDLNKYKVRGIPLVIIEKDDEIVERLTGTMTKNKYQEIINKHESR